VLVASTFTGEPESIHSAASTLEGVFQAGAVQPAPRPASASSMAPSACLAKRPRSRA
jgi:hypothetical protein